MSQSTIPTLAEIQAAIDSLLVDVTADAGGVLMRLANLLESGDVALLSREDREQALRSQRIAVRCYDRTPSDFARHDQELNRARQLLQLDPPEAP